MATRLLHAGWMLVVLLFPVSVSQAALDPEIERRLAALSVPFVSNAGQWDRTAAFAAQTPAGTLFVTIDGRLVHSLPGKTLRELPDSGESAAARLPRSRHGRVARAPGWVLTESLVDARGQAIAVTPRGDRLQEGAVSFAVGNSRAAHRDGVPAYERIKLGEAYPGTDVHLRATGSNVEKVFVVAPHRSPGAIRIRMDGARGLEIGPQGELIAHTGNGPVTYTRPIAYQEDLQGERAAVDVRYALNAANSTYGFDVGRYDSSLPLIIDPLLQSTYLGGDGDDRGPALAIHPATGDVYVAGLTLSTDFPKVTGSQQSAHAADGGNHDAYVTRLNAALTTRLQSTYLGGDGDDAAFALAIHPASGDVYVAGHTTSTDFPAVAGSEQPSHATDAGKYDVFVTRLNAALTTRLQSTYLGGNGDDQAFALAIHPMSGEVYVAGFTTSTDLPKTTGSEQPSHAADAGNYDAFVTRLDAALTSRVQSIYLGGDDYDDVSALAIHPMTGEIYVAGYTVSSDLPKAAGSEQPAHAADGGLGDAFVSRLNAALTFRLQSAYLGGSGEDGATALAIHPTTGEVYVAGDTGSTDFPKVAGAEQTTLAGGSDVFVTRFNAGLTTRVQSTYLGGGGDEFTSALAIHPATGDVYVAGYTDSINLPKVSGGDQPAKGAASDAFVTRLDAALTVRVQSTYLGGSSDERARSLALHPLTGEVLVSGNTQSTDFPGTVGAEQATHGADSGKFDAFVARYSLDLQAGSVVPSPFAFAPKLNVPVASQQMSAPALINGISGSVPIALSGGNFAQYCISSSADCGCDVQAFTNAAATVNNNQHVCVRQSAPSFSPAQARATLVIGGGYADFIVSTGSNLLVCSLDVDGNGAPDALTDGLMIIRALFGLTGTAVTSAAVGDGATRGTWAQIQPYLNGNCGANFAP